MADEVKGRIIHDCGPCPTQSSVQQRDGAADCCSCVLSTSRLFLSLEVTRRLLFMNSIRNFLIRLQCISPIAAL